MSARRGRAEPEPLGSFSDPRAKRIELGKGLTLLVWNVHKARSSGLAGELAALCADHSPDIVALQEGRESIELPEGFAGHGATSFRRAGIGPREGVITLSRVAPVEAHRVRSAERELFVATPKAALITLYDTDVGAPLCVVNLHGLNFDPTGGQLRRQLDDLAERVARFDGPLVVCGDFNAWNAPRDAAVQELARRLGLSEVLADYPGGTKGRIPGKTIQRALGLDQKLHLDRAFARGLRPRTAHWAEGTSASDHVPLILHLLPA